MGSVNLARQEKPFARLEGRAQAALRRLARLDRAGAATSEAMHEPWNLIEPWRRGGGGLECHAETRPPCVQCSSRRALGRIGGPFCYTRVVAGQ